MAVSSGGAIFSSGVSGGLSVHLVTPEEPHEIHPDWKLSDDEAEERENSYGTGDLPTFSSVDEAFRRSRGDGLKSYSALCDETADVFLHKLVLSGAGCRVFDRLCDLIDINQQYAELLPQWRDLAQLLRVDETKTDWIKVCVRPQEGLTRAMLEIYMKDGGTLGEVLEALLKLECFVILEKLRPPVCAYLEDRKSGALAKEEDEKQAAAPHDKFFSALATLASAFGGDAGADPCFHVRQFAGGLKKASPAAVGEAVTTSEMVVSSPGQGVLCNDPNPLWMEERPRTFDKKAAAVKRPWEKREGDLLACRMLLVFASDGLEAAQSVEDSLQGLVHKGVRAEVFRMNDASLWYEMLVNPEGCCMKWANEADFVVPVLTPNFVREIHCNSTTSTEEEEWGMMLPTSPVINRFMYTLMRARYADEGCRNTMIRPVLPTEFVAQLAKSNAVVRDPMFRLIWVTEKEDRLVQRTKMMMEAFARKH